MFTICFFIFSQFINLINYIKIKLIILIITVRERMTKQLITINFNLNKRAQNLLIMGIKVIRFDVESSAKMFNNTMNKYTQF